MDQTAAELTFAREALVVFEDRDDARLLRWLRPGFRHCFCLAGEDRRWTLCDPLKSRLTVATVTGLSAEELALRLGAVARRRFLFGLVAAGPGPSSGGLRPLTCVEVVKRLIGLRAPSVLTPFQLYQRLVRAGVDGSTFAELGRDRPIQ